MSSEIGHRPIRQNGFVSDFDLRTSNPRWIGGLDNDSGRSPAERQPSKQAAGRQCRSGELTKGYPPTASDDARCGLAGAPSQEPLRSPGRPPFTLKGNAACGSRVGSERKPTEAGPDSTNPRSRHHDQNRAMAEARIRFSMPPVVVAWVPATKGACRCRSTYWYSTPRSTALNALRYEVDRSGRFGRVGGRASAR